MPETVPNRARRVAYVVSRFPKLTETFILFEMLALERQGVRVELYPLLRARDTKIKVEGATLLAKILALMSPAKHEVVMHPEARPFVERAHFFPFFSWAILCSQLYFLARAPRTYLGALATLIRANWGSANYLIGTLSTFPKVAHIARHMKRRGIGHVHAHFANHPAAAAFVIRRLVGIPYSFTAHGADLQVDQHMLRDKVRESDFVVTISRYNRSFIGEHCGAAARDKVLVIHCGVDTAIFRAKPKKPDGPFTIMCTGTFYEVKGHTYLIEACRLLKERGLNVICNLVGSGPLQQALAEQVRDQGLQEHVFFLGQRNRNEISELLQRADAVCTPSIPTDSGRREGIPVVIMEAMASGVPVVASEISGIPELVEHEKNGLLVPPKNGVAIADALERLCSDAALREQLGKAARETIERDFDLFANAAALARHFTRGSAQ